MRHSPIALVILVAAIIHSTAPASDAQYPGVRNIRSRYSRPPRPTFSPYFDLFRTDNTGPLGNYHSYVRPKQQLYDTLWQQHSNLRRQDASIRALGQQVSGTKQWDRVRPTGTNSTFMNYSHYFPSQ
jgi:hypothetical protein